MKISCITLFASTTLSALAMASGIGTRPQGNPFAGLGEDIAGVHFTLAGNQPPMTEGEARVLASRLFAASGVDLTFNPGRSSQQQMVFTTDLDRSAILRIGLRNGSFLFNAGMNGLRVEGDTPNLPDRPHAVAIAVQHLRDLNLLPDPDQMEVENIGGLHMAVHREDGTTDEYRKLVTVRFSRNVGETPVEGPGGRILVKLGNAGRLRGLVWNWERFSPSPVGDADKLTLIDVVRLARLTVGSVAQSAVEKTIESADLVYYDDGFGVMEPAIHVVAGLTFITPVSGRTETVTIQNPYDFYIPLLRAPRGYYPFMEDQGVPPPIRD